MDGSVIEFRFDVLLDEAIQVPFYYAADNVALIYVNGELAAYTTIALNNRNLDIGDAYSANALGELLYGDFDGRWTEGWNYVYKEDITLEAGVNEIIIAAADSSSNGHFDENGIFIKGTTGTDNDIYDLTNNPCGLIFSFQIPASNLAATFNNYETPDITVKKEIHDPSDNSWEDESEIIDNETAEFKITITNNGGEGTVYLQDVITGYFDNEIKSKNITTAYSRIKKSGAISNIIVDKIGNEIAIKFEGRGEVVIYYQEEVIYYELAIPGNVNKYTNEVTWTSEDKDGNEVEKGKDEAEVTAVPLVEPSITKDVLYPASGNITEGDAVTFKITVGNENGGRGDVYLTDVIKSFSNATWAYNGEIALYYDEFFTNEVEYNDIKEAESEDSVRVFKVTFNSNEDIALYCKVAGLMVDDNDNLSTTYENTATVTNEDGEPVRDKDGAVIEDDATVIVSIPSIVTITKEIQDPSDSDNWVKKAEFNDGGTALFRITVTNEGGPDTVYLQDIFNGTENSMSAYKVEERSESVSDITKNGSLVTIIFDDKGEVVFTYEVKVPDFEDTAEASNTYENIIKCWTLDTDGNIVPEDEDAAEITVVAPIIEIEKTIIGGNDADGGHSISVDSGATVTFKITVTNSGTAAGSISLVDFFEYLNSSSAGYDSVVIKVYDSSGNEATLGSDFAAWLNDANNHQISTGSLSLPAGYRLIIYATITMDYQVPVDVVAAGAVIAGLMADQQMLLAQYEAEANELNELEAALTAAAAALNENTVIIIPVEVTPNDEQDETNGQSDDFENTNDEPQIVDPIITQADYDNLLLEFNTVFADVEQLLSQISAITYALDEVEEEADGTSDDQGKTYNNKVTVYLNNKETDSDNANVTVLPNKELKIEKEVSADGVNWDSNTVIASGDTAYFKVTVTNTGDVGISNINLTDFFNDGTALVIPGAGSFSLESGESITFTYQVTLRNNSFENAVSFINTATATYTDEAGNNIETDDSAEVTVKPQKKAYATIIGTKTFTGATLSAGMFNFILRDGSGETVATATNDANGGFKYEISFTKAGTYRYTVYEQKGSNRNITYDENIFNIEITVTESNGVLNETAQVVYSGGTMVFVNTYSEGNGGGDNNGNGEDNPPPPRPEVEKTDNTNTDETDEIDETTETDEIDVIDETEEIDETETPETEELVEGEENDDQERITQQEEINEPLNWEPAAWVPNNYAPSQVDNVYIMFDEDGTPLGYFTPVLKEDGDPTNPDDYIWIEVDEFGVPLGNVEISAKENPKTGQEDNFAHLGMLFAALLFASVALIVGFKKKLTAVK